MQILHEYRIRGRIWTLPILRTHMDATHLQMDIKTVRTHDEKAQVDIQSRKSFVKVNNGAKLSERMLMMC